MNCITLLSDLGLHDASVAIAKGILMQHTSLPIIDITHEIKPYNIQQAAYLLKSTYRNFPANTIHVLLFDMYPGINLNLVLCTHDDHFFITADNGLLPMALNIIPQARLIAAIDKEQTFTQWMTETGKAIQKYQESGTFLTLTEYELKKAGKFVLPEIIADSIACEVIHIDQFENVVLNVTKDQFETAGKGRKFRISFMVVEEVTELSKNYNDVREGFKLCRFNSTGHLELCINRGRAASLFGLRLGSKHNNIKIYFE